ncbi:TauD/TfdA family dioxygenase [Streptomyces sp. NBC_01408]|uniref:TauD/TfdA family dioxygenase n=1 Tax=Streptomyces sp. NBC_01408 TaxID=2903855 RepID=UPI0022516FD5|nr:TauD/TfdA family dioxygenase [Streptomyces sp. NBC_01408]MCX4692923.1 TauD/TfdA family dioxygenase [Streptomyces sp. NBC_01408]
MTPGTTELSTRELPDSIETGIPVVTVAAANALDRLAESAAELRATALERGAVLVRGLDIRTHEHAAAASRALTSELMREVEGFAPRQALPGGVYSSTEWPPDQPMCMHHELTSAPRHPQWMIFSCLSAGTTGGAVSLADASKVLDDLPAEILEPFAQDGWQLVRNYDQLVGLSSAAAFGTDDPAAVDAYCRLHGIGFSRSPGGGLHTRQTLPAVVTHPVTGRRCWFNQIAFLNEWTMDPAVREFLVSEFGAEGLPFNTLFADGTPLTPAIVETINAVYDRHAMRVPLRDGDLLLVDNIGTSHSREPYGGEREMVVALGDPLPRLHG